MRFFLHHCDWHFNSPIKIHATMVYSNSISLRKVICNIKTCLLTNSFWENYLSDYAVCFLQRLSIDDFVLCILTWQSPQTVGVGLDAAPRRANNEGKSKYRPTAQRGTVCTPPELISPESPVIGWKRGKGFRGAEFTPKLGSDGWEVMRMFRSPIIWAS